MNYVKRDDGVWLDNYGTCKPDRKVIDSFGELTTEAAGMSETEVRDAFRVFRMAPERTLGSACIWDD